MTLLDSPPDAPPVHLALARKWRPRRFAEVIGQEQTLAVLTGALSSGRVHHAFMFTGIRGIGKTTLARIFAKALNCENPSGAEPCCECSSCRQLEAGSHPDMIEIDAASTTQVDSMRELLDSARYAPALGKFKVYIIDEVHMLSRHSFNAMLKTLEEPPAHVKFVLATTDPQQVPATVQSRCLRFALRRLPVDLIVAGLTKICAAEKLVCEAGALKVIAQAADGSMRDALSIFDEAISAEALTEPSARELVGLAGGQGLRALLNHVLAGQAQEALDCAAELHRSGIAADHVLAGLIGLVHETQLAYFAPKLSAASEIAMPSLDPVRMQVVYEVAAQARERMGFALTDPQVILELALLRMLALFTETASAPAAAPASTPAPPPSVPAPTPAAPVAAATESKSKLPQTNEQWQQLCFQLAQAPQAKALAGHCVFKRAAGNVLHLELAAAKDSLHSYTSNLEQELGALCGQKIKLAINTVAEINQTTPNQQEDRQAKDADAKVIKQLEASPEFARLKSYAPDSKIVRVLPGHRQTS